MAAKNENKPITDSVTLAPFDFKLNVDDEFVDFCKNKLQGTEVSTGKTVIVKIIGHAIRLHVKRCTPENSKIGKHTDVVLLRFDTRSDMSLTETSINIFMTDDQVKKIISDLIVDTIITEENGIALWKEFKQHQNNTLVL